MGAAWGVMVNGRWMVRSGGIARSVYTALSYIHVPWEKRIHHTPQHTAYATKPQRLSSRLRYYDRDLLYRRCVGLLGLSDVTIGMWTVSICYTSTDNCNGV